MSPGCQPLTPEICYQAIGASSCLLGWQGPIGMWTLTLTSVAPHASDAGASDIAHYIVHGSFVATMIEEQTTADAGAVTADLSIKF